MEAKKMLAVLGAMSVAATAVPVVAAIMRDDSEQKNGDNNVLLYSGPGRNDSFAKKPISTEEVSYRGGYFQEWGRRLGLKNPSLLTADAGGILLDDSVKFVDLGMLCDREIARCLGELNENPQRAQFHEYVFKTVRPDFIATRAYHSWLAGLDMDERFRREYVPIHEYVDLWGLDRRNTVMMSGDYVRRDLVASKPEILDLLVREAASLYYPFENKSIELTMQKRRSGK